MRCYYSGDTLVPSHSVPALRSHITVEVDLNLGRWVYDFVRGGLYLRPK